LSLSPPARAEGVCRWFFESADPASQPPVAWTAPRAGRTPRPHDASLRGRPRHPPCPRPL